MKFKSNVKKNYLFSAAYQILLVFTPLITTPYIARVFGASGVGAYTIAHTVALYFLKFANMGIGVYGNRCIAYVRDEREAINKTFTEIYLAQLLFCFLSLTAYLLYATFFPIGDHTLVYIHLLYVSSAFFDVTWLYYGIEKIDIIVIINGIIKIVNIICIFAFVKDIGDIWKYTLIMCISSLINNLIVWTKGFDFVKLRKVEIKCVLRRLLPIIVLFIPVVASSVYKSMDKLMLGLLADSEELVGLYNNSEQIIGVPQGLITAVGLVMLPRISNQIATGEERKAVDEMYICMRFVNFLACAVTFGIASIAPEFVPLFLGDSFIKCIDYVILLAPCNLFISWGYAIRNQYLIPKKKDMIYILSILAGAAINFLINIMLIPQMGIIGAIIGTIAAEFLVAVLQTLAIRKSVNISIFLTDAMPFFIIGIFMALIIRKIGDTMGIHVYTVLVEIVTGSILYISISIVYLYLFEKKELFRLIRLIKE